ncbi:MAG: HlyD family efflux transporter periplasmic adaptor subunit [Myxococcota bacterium]
MAQERKNDLKKQLGRWFRRGLFALALVGLLALVVRAFLPKPVPVDLVSVTRGDLQVTVDEDGRSRVKDRYVVSAPLAGNVARLELTPGDSVEAGAVLARVVPIEPPLMDSRSVAQAEARVSAARAGQRQARSTISRAQTSLRHASQQLARQRGLQQGGASSQVALEEAELRERTLREDLTSARFAAQVADYELQVAEASLLRLDRRAGSDSSSDEQLEVVSPVSGRILRVYQESEGVVAAGAPLVEIGDPAALEIVVDVLTSDAVEVAPGSRVRIDRWGGDRALDGRVRVIEPSAFTRLSALGVEEQRVNVVIDILDPHEHWRALGDGYRVEAQIVVFHAEDVLRVPSNAVWAVYLATEGIAALQPVEIGRDNGLETEVVGGLDEGAMVAAHPSDAVRDGVSIVRR